MKKIGIILILILSISYRTYSQEGGYRSSVGLAFGLPTGLNYKTFVSTKGAIDLVGGVRLGIDFVEIRLVGLYEHHISTNVTGLRFYFGGGGSFYHTNVGKGNVWLGLNASLGGEYKIENVPLVLAADWTPVFWLSGNKDLLSIQSGAFKIRYVF